MLYIVELQVEHHYTETIVFENDVTGSTKYVNILPKQTKIIDATDEAAARQKVKDYYTSLDNDNLKHNINILSVNETII